jgi:hypothetical protein
MAKESRFLTEQFIPMKVVFLEGEEIDAPLVRTG